jgi:hypothetical protein
MESLEWHIPGVKASQILWFGAPAGCPGEGNSETLAGSLWGSGLFCNVSASSSWRSQSGVATYRRLRELGLSVGAYFTGLPPGSLALPGLLAACKDGLQSRYAPPGDVQ